MTRIRGRQTRHRRGLDVAAQVASVRADDGWGIDEEDLDDLGDEDDDLDDLDDEDDDLGDLDEEEDDLDDEADDEEEDKK